MKIIEAVDYQFKNANLWIKGLGKDVNGNSIIKLFFPNQKAFSIQVGGNLPETNTNLFRTGIKVKDIENLSDKIKTNIENEIIKYIKKFGSSKQKGLLKTYKGYKENIEMYKVDRNVKINEEIVLEAGDKIRVLKEGKINTLDLYQAFLPWGSLDVGQAIRVINDADLDVDEIVDLAEELRFKSLKDVDIVALAYEVIIQIARNEIEKKARVDIQNDYDFYVAGNYMATSFDGSNADDLQKVLTDKGLSLRDFSKATTYFLDDIGIS